MAIDFSSYITKIEEVLKNALPKNPNSEWQKKSFGKLPNGTNAEHFAPLLLPTRNLMDQGGKRWRPLLLILCTELVCETNKKNSNKKSKLALENAYKLTSLIEFIHTASLIHDDIEDNATIRRGKPCAHIAYGIDTALNAASYLYFQAATCISQIKVDKKTKNCIYKMATTQVRRLHLGQAMDIEWHKNPSLFPSIEEYNAMISLKTGTLSFLAAWLGFFIGGESLSIAKKAGNIACLIGVGFQILDDVQNLTTGNKGKIKGDDIIEGKKSLPILLHISHHPEDKTKIEELFNKVKSATNNSVNSTTSNNNIYLLINEFISIIESSGAIEEAFLQGKNLVQKKYIELTQLLDKEQKTASAKKICALFEQMLPLA